MVEVGGIEPPSANPTLSVLHVFPVFHFNQELPNRQGKPQAIPDKF